MMTLAIPEVVAGQDPAVSIQIGFDYSSKTADVEPGGDSNGIVTNTGIVVVGYQAEPRIVVTPEVTAGGWPVAVTPSQGLEFWWWENGVAKEFTVTVRVPSGTSHKVSQNVVAVGAWRGQATSGRGDSTSMIIFVEQYFRVFTEAEGKVSANAGERFSIPVTIWNTGNDEDDFIVDIDNRRSLERDGWSFNEVPKVTIGEMEKTTIAITGRAPDHACFPAIRINVTSEKSMLSDPDGTRYSVFTVKVKVEKDWSPFLFGLGSMLIVGSVITIFFVRKKRRSRLK